jgi:transcriptional regulator with XRE-family HTH domain
MNVSKDNRLIEALRIRNMTQAELSKRTNLPSSMINQYCQGRNKPKYENVKMIAAVLKVSIDWLMGENVPMEPNELEKKLLNLFRMLNDFGKSKLFEYLEDLTENIKYTQNISNSKKTA